MKKILSIIIQELFYVLLAALIILTCLELLIPLSVQPYINLNIILLLWLADSILLLMVGPGQTNNES